MIAAIPTPKPGGRLPAELPSSASVGLGIGDHMPSAVFDDLVALVAQRFGTRHAGVYLVVPEGGLIEVADLLDVDVPENQRPAARRVVPEVERLCAGVVDSRSILVRSPRALEGAVLEDTDSIAVDEARFYVGLPLTAADGTAVGVLCAWDSRQHDPTPDDIQALEQFGRHAMTMIDLHRVAFELDGEREVLTATGYLLEMIVEGAELPVVLNSLALAAEAAIPGTTCSIHLLEGSVLRDGASPHLSESYRAAINGLPIGPMAGSCGTAAHTGRTVIVSDIATDLRWRQYRELALPQGLRACWSVPIPGPNGDVLGTFALYYRDIRVPRLDELERLARWVNLAEVAISRARDITALRAAATLDSLTGLVNRTAILSRIESAVAGSAGRPAVLFVDLDQFKFVNDTLGHAAGDQFLRVVATRLANCAGLNDTVARFGGDEFLVLRPACSGHEEVEALAHEIIGSLHRPMTINGRTLSLSASIGIALRPDGADPQQADPQQADPRHDDPRHDDPRHDDPHQYVDLVSDADLAMYAAKRTGRNSVATFTPDMRAGAADRLSLEADLNMALANGELYCAYQPSVDMGTGKILGVEALLRWNSPSRGAVAPDDFVPVAEESGLVLAVGQFVLGQSCAQLATWRAAAPDWRDVVMWVNVSPRQLLDPGFADRVDDLLAAGNLPPSALGLEVTESTFIEDSTLVRTNLLQLRGRGVHIAIDDFGTGYSSLAQLEHLPVDVLKIDQQFIAGIASGGVHAGLVAAIITLAKTMGLSVVAEGVETEVQRDSLLSLGCRAGQGYLWSAAVEPGHFDLSLLQFARATMTGRTGRHQGR